MKWSDLSLTTTILSSYSTRTEDGLMRKASITTLMQFSATLLSPKVTPKANLKKSPKGKAKFQMKCSN